MICSIFHNSLVKNTLSNAHFTTNTENCYINPVAIVTTDCQAENTLGQLEENKFLCSRLQTKVCSVKRFDEIVSLCHVDIDRVVCNKQIKPNTQCDSSTMYNKLIQSLQPTHRNLIHV